jgi:hypothetical protein
VNERLGVNKDVEVLSDFIINKLNKAEPDKTYVFQKENKENKKNLPLLQRLLGRHRQRDVINIDELPELDINLYKIIINYRSSVNVINSSGKTEKFDPKSEGSFDPLHSKLTKDGYIFHFSFTHRKLRDKIWKHYIYHEVNHAIQFVKMGKTKMKFNPKYLRNNILKESFDVFPYRDFLSLVYLSINIEQGSFVAELYGKLKYRKIKNVQELRDYFTKRKNYEFRLARDLSNVDVKKMFNVKARTKDGKTTPVTTTDQKLIFFTVMKQLGKRISEFDSVEDFFKNIPIKIDIDKKITEVELDATLDRYTRYFNKVGKKMDRKLDKIYTLLYDYFENKDPDFLK